MKKIMAVIMSMTMVLGLCACEDKDDSSSKKDENTSSVTESSEESSSEVEDSSDNEDSSEVTTTAPDSSNDNSEEYTTTKYDSQSGSVDVVKPVSLNQLLYDDNNIKVTLTSCQTNEDNINLDSIEGDDDYLLYLNCNIENKSDKNICLSLEDVRVNDFSYDSTTGTEGVGFVDNEGIKAGSTVSDHLAINSSIIAAPYNTNFGDIKKLQFKVVIRDRNTVFSADVDWDDSVLYTSDTITLNLK